ncbi:MAG: hypothetical protein KKB51_01400 [Candidatus Riflebacteria bacterium]|nr:hypothetical protein [Candidatus Riflebacteria bacterium]
MTESALISHVLEISGFELEVLGESSLQILLEKRKKCIGVSDDQAYLQILKQNPAEWLLLLEELVVPETWFFRDQETFNFIAELARQFISAHPDSTLRIFSAPCASGEEPYSIAMALLEAGLPETSFVIEAIDVSPRQIEKAMIGHYSMAIPRGCTSEIVAKYFIRNGSNLELSEKVRKLVHFSQGSLIGEFGVSSMLPFHIILCKNLMIYLSDKSRSALLRNLRQVLTRDGVLFAGHSEIPFLCKNGFRMHGPAGAFACQLQGDTESGNKVQKVRTPTKGRTGTDKTSVCKPPIIPRQKSDVTVNLPPDQAAVLPPDKLKDLQCLADKGKFEEALSLGEIILRETPVPRAYFLVGLVKQALNNFSAAEEMFQRALYLDNSFSEAVVALGLLYEKQGNTDKSQVFQDRARRLAIDKEKRA